MEENTSETQTCFLQNLKYTQVNIDLCQSFMELISYPIHLVNGVSLKGNF